MQFIGLISGGKDSIYNIISCINKGHKLIALGHLARPELKGELDSYMYQTVGSELCKAIAECLDVPLIKRVLTKAAINKEIEYKETKDDEVEELYLLIKEAKEQFPELSAVSSGAILSTYQMNRVENVCKRLQLTSLAFLWQRNQKEMLQEMIDNDIQAVLIKVCAMGLDKIDMMKSLKEMQNKLLDLEKKYQLNVCGEGGEYETITLDCNIYKKKIRIDDYTLITHSLDPFSPVYYACINKYHLENK